MNYLSTDDIIDGKIYHLKQKTTNSFWIIKIHKIENPDRYCSIRGPSISYCNNDEYSKPSYYNGGNWGHYNIIEQLRLATNKEIKWLENCIKTAQIQPIPTTSNTIIHKLNLET